MYHDERMFREEDRGGHAETTQVSIPKDVNTSMIYEILDYLKLANGF